MAAPRWIRRWSAAGLGLLGALLALEPFGRRMARAMLAHGFVP